MSTHSCPKGHISAEADYCDTCGARIASAPSFLSEARLVASTPEEAAEGGPDPEPCPVCSTPRGGTDRFCEYDGYDFTTGRQSGRAAPVPAPVARQAPSPVAALAAVPVPEPIPVLAAAPAQAPVSGSAGICWTATVEADRRYYDQVSVDGVDFPGVCPIRTFTLIGSQLSIGRRSVSKGIYPEIDLSGPPLDPGVSHLHAVLSSTSKGGWAVSDPGSTNGTTINGGDNAIDSATAVDVGDGSRIHIGAWTTITLHAPR